MGAQRGRAARQHYERVFIHVLVLTSTVLNEDFHAKMRAVLAPYVVDGVGVMQKNPDGSWRKTPVNGAARMEWCVLRRRAPPLRTHRPLFSSCSLSAFSRPASVANVLPTIVHFPGAGPRATSTSCA